MDGKNRLASLLLTDRALLLKTIGLSFVVLAALLCTAYAILLFRFDYPLVLQKTAGQALLLFRQGGLGLIFLWAAFGLLSLPLFAGLFLLPAVMENKDNGYLRIATIMSIIALFQQLIGLVRWIFVTPHLAGVYGDPSAAPEGREAALATFNELRDVGGIILGETMGTFFILMWMVVISVGMLRSPLFRPWLGAVGLAVSGGYFLVDRGFLDGLLPAAGAALNPDALFPIAWLGWIALTGVVLLCARSNRLRAPDWRLF